MSKISKHRKSGYYWVGWSYSQDTKNVVQRIAYYNERFCTWTIDGDSGLYTNDRFINIDKRPIGQRLGWYHRLISGIITALVVLILIFMLASALVMLINALTCK